MANLSQELYFTGSKVGARGAPLQFQSTPSGSGDYLGSAGRTDQGLLQKREEENQQSSSSGNSNMLDQLTNSASSTPAAGTTGTGSNLVSGSFGSSTYAPTGFGLQGASTGMTYAGGTAGSLGASSGLIGSSGGATAGAATGGSSFGLGGSLVGGSGTVGGSTFAAGGSSAAAGGGAASGGGALASAGPWAALAAAIIANENYQKKSGNRDQGTGKQIEHALTGKVVEDDASVWGEKIDKGNKLGIKGDMEVGSDFATGDFSNAFKNLDETFGIKTLKKLFGG